MLPAEVQRSSLSGFTLLEMLVVVVILAAVAGLVVSNVDRTNGDAEGVVARATMKNLREAIVGSPAGVGYIADMKYVPGFRAVDLRTADLLARRSEYPEFDPVAHRGWRGPYLGNAAGVANTNTARNGMFPAGYERRFAGDSTFLERGFFVDTATSNYGEIGDLAAADPWGNPIVVQVPPMGGGDAKRFRYARLVSAGADGQLDSPLEDRLAGMLVDGTATARGDDLVLFLNRSDTYESEEP